MFCLLRMHLPLKYSTAHSETLRIILLALFDKFKGHIFHFSYILILVCVSSALQQHHICLDNVIKAFRLWLESVSSIIRFLPGTNSATGLHLIWRVWHLKGALSRHHQRIVFNYWYFSNPKCGLQKNLKPTPHQDIPSLSGWFIFIFLIRLKRAILIQKLGNYTVEARCRNKLCSNYKYSTVVNKSIYVQKTQGRCAKCAQAGITKVCKLYVHYLLLSLDKMSRIHLSQRRGKLYRVMALSRKRTEAITESTQRSGIEGRPLGQ